MEQHFEIYRPNGATIAGYVEDGDIILTRRDRQNPPVSLMKNVLNTINDDIGDGVMYRDDWIVHVR